MNLVWDLSAWVDYLRWQTQDPNVTPSLEWWVAPCQLPHISRPLQPQDLHDAIRVGTFAGVEHPGHLGPAGWERPGHGQLHPKSGRSTGVDATPDLLT